MNTFFSFMKTEISWKLIYFLLLGIIFIFYACLSIHYSKIGGDVDQDVAAAHALMNNISIYSEDAKIIYEKHFSRKFSQRNFHPPINSIIFLPFTYGSAHLAFNFFNLISFLALLFGLKIVLSNFCREKVRTILMISIFLSYPTFSSIANGQLSPILFFLISCSYFFIKQKKQFLSALLLSTASSMKLYPVFYSVTYIIKKEYKAFFYFIFTFSILQLSVYFIVGKEDFFYFFKHLSSGLNAYSHYMHNISLYSFIEQISSRYVFNYSPLFPCVYNILVAIIFLLIVMKTDVKNSYEYLFSLISIFACLVTPIFWEHGLLVCVFIFMFLNGQNTLRKISTICVFLIFFFPNLYISQKINELYIHIPFLIFIFSKIITLSLILLFYYLLTLENTTKNLNCSSE